MLYKWGRTLVVSKLYYNMQRLPSTLSSGISGHLQLSISPIRADLSLPFQRVQEKYIIQNLDNKYPNATYSGTLQIILKIHVLSPMEISRTGLSQRRETQQPSSKFAKTCIILEVSPSWEILRTTMILKSRPINVIIQFLLLNEGIASSNEITLFLDNRDENFWLEINETVN